MDFIYMFWSSKHEQYLPVIAPNLTTLKMKMNDELKKEKMKVLPQVFLGRLMTPDNFENKPINKIYFWTSDDPEKGCPCTRGADHKIPIEEELEMINKRSSHHIYIIEGRAASFKFKSFTQVDNLAVDVNIQF